jgi:hypothetical protein
MINVKNSLVALGLLMMSAMSSVNASILIEPHLGYNISGGTSDYASSKYEYKGAQYGSKLGFNYLGLMAGFDFNYGTFTLDRTTNAGVKTSAEYKQTDLGIFVGYNAPVLIRGWIGYYFSSKAENANSSTNYFKGTITELGLGFRPLPLLSLNVAYRMVAYDKQSVNSVESTLSPKFDPTEIVLSVSLPINLL